MSIYAKEKIKYGKFQTHSKSQEGKIGDKYEANKIGIKMNMLIFNVGSATIKYAIYKRNEKVERRTIYAKPSLKLIKEIVDKARPDCIVHRVVHGYGLKSCFINDNVIKKIKQTIKLNLAPLHNPNELKVIEYCKKLSNAKQIAVFDNDFYDSMPEVAKLCPVPKKIVKKYRIRNYGFHGINHNYVLKQVAKYLRKPKNEVSIISLHLGSGSSITAIANGRPIDTTMNFTPLSGVIMRTRPGDIDPMVPLVISKFSGYNNSIDILNKKSGMLALTGKDDFRKIIKNLNHKTHKNEYNKFKVAFDFFVGQIFKTVSAYYGLLKSMDLDLDCIVFTAGIGENCWQLRSAVCKKLNWMGLKIDERVNKKVNEKSEHKPHVISSNRSKHLIIVVHQNEEEEMKEIALRLLDKGKLGK